MIEKGLLWLILAGCILVPPSGLVTTALAEALCLGLTLLLSIWRICNGLRKGCTLPTPQTRSLLTLLGLLTGMSVVSQLLNHIPLTQVNWLGLIYIVTAASVVWVTQLRSYSTYTLSVIILSGSLLLAFSGYIQFFQLLPFGIGLRAEDPANFPGMYGLLGQRNLFANYIFCGVLSTLWLRQTNKLSPFTTLLVLFFLTVALAASGSRTVWVYLLLFAPIAALRLGLTGYLLWCVLTLASLRLFSPTDLPVVIRQASEYSSLVANPRVVLAYEAYQVWTQSPSTLVWGVGFGQLRDYTAGMPITERHTHNLFTQWAAEAGLAGLLIVVGLFAEGWRASTRAWKSGQWLAPAILGGQAIHSMLEFPLWHAQFLMLTAVCIGLTLSPQHSSTRA